MKYAETVASRCRYGDIAERIFGDAEIIWECSTADYQGSANLLAAFPDGRFAHYEWSYGSCSGCDEWESRDLTDDAIEEEMRSHVGWLADENACARYLKLEGEFANAPVPTANTPTNGSVPGMIRHLFGGIASEFQEMGDAFVAWKSKRG